jgi:hypothetical protein
MFFLSIEESLAQTKNPLTLPLFCMSTIVVQEALLWLNHEENFLANKFSDRETHQHDFFFPNKKW